MDLIHFVIRLILPYSRELPQCLTGTTDNNFFLTVAFKCLFFCDIYFFKHQNLFQMHVYYPKKMTKQLPVELCQPNIAKSKAATPLHQAPPVATSVPLSVVLANVKR